MFDKRRYLLIVWICFLAGCGYQMGSLISPGINSVAIPVFRNQTLYRNFEFTLSEAVIKEVLTATNLRVMPSDRADTVLNGKILKMRQSTVIKNEKRLSTQFDINITVEIEWKDQRTGKMIIRPKRLSHTIQVFAERGENFQTAAVLALGKLARTIVYSMENPSLIHAKPQFEDIEDVEDEEP